MNINALGIPLLLVCSAHVLMAGPVQWTVASGGNDHYYEFVSSPCGSTSCLRWDSALTEAASMSYLGMQGYLATETTLAEAIFVRFNTGVGNLHAWIGGSDEGDDGNFTWRAGPETGQSIMQYNAQTQQIECTQAWCDPGTFRLSSEVNYIMITNTPFGVDWLSNTVDNHFPGFPSDGFGRPPYGYIVEYGGDTPDPNTFGLLTSGIAALVCMRRDRRCKLKR